MKNEYTCDACGETFKKGWSDKEANKEAKKIWGDIPQNEQVVICDDCFNKRTPVERETMGIEYQENKNKV